MKKTIRTVAELRTLRSFKGRLGIRDVSIELPGASDENRKFEAEIKRYLNSCGCELGAIFVGGGIAIIVVFSLFAPNHFNWASPKTILEVVGYLASLAVIGKIIGLAIANKRLQMTINKLEHNKTQMANQQQ